MDQAWSYKGFGFEIWIVMLWNDIDNKKCFKVFGRRASKEYTDGDWIHASGK